MGARESLHALWLRMRALARRAELDRSLDDELRFHLEMRREQQRALGLPEPQADAAARRRFGNVVALREEIREMWSFGRLETLWQDARFAGRVLRKNPGFSAVAVASLALGIGANAAIFSVVNAVLLRPLPYHEPERLVRLTGFYPAGAIAALRQGSRTLDVAGARPDQEFNMTGRGEAVRLSGAAVSANLFALLGRQASLGRAFADGDDRPGADRLVLLSHALWRSRFGGDPRVIGASVRLDGTDREVVGVMPADFRFPSAATQLWVPLRLDPSEPEAYWGFGWMPALARLRDGASQAQAQAELRAEVARIAGLFPWPARDWNLNAGVVPLQQDLVQGVQRRLLLLQSAVGLVLLIACANVAGLLLARAAARRKEMALRAALGAGRGRLLRQLLVESLALSLLGGAAGLALAQLGLDALRSAFPADVAAGIELDAGVLGFVALLALLCSVVSGLAPAASASRAPLAGVIKAGGQRAAPPAATRLRSAFVAAELALAVVLAVGAGLLIRTLSSLADVDPGFRSERTLTLRVSPDPSSCDVRAACIAFYDDLLRALRAEAGVSEVAAASTLPLSGDAPLLPVEVEGHAFVPGQAGLPLLWAGAVTPGYLGAMRIPLLQGRNFDDGDAERAAPVVMVSAATARRYWPGQDPVGKRVRIVWDRHWRKVVGVVADVRQFALSGHTPDGLSGALYMPYPQSVALDRRIPASMALVVRAASDAPELHGRIRRAVASARPDVPVGEVRAMGAIVASSVSEPRSLTWLFAGFAGCALLLAAIGTYGVVSYWTAQRSYEIGVRVALGATRRDVLGLVLGQSLKLVLAGLGLGAAAALPLGRALSSFLYGVGTADPLTFAGVAALLLLTALWAGYLPGRRAAAADALRAMRSD